MKKIIICATARCGSTLVCKELEATHVLGYPKEYYLQSNHVRDAATAQQVITDILKRGTSQNGVFAVKVMQAQWPLVENLHANLPQNRPSLFKQAIKRLTQRYQTPAETSLNLEHFYTFYQEATWVYLKRRNTLYQAISREMARQTEVCHVLKQGVDQQELGQTLSSEQAAQYNEKAIYVPNKLKAHIQTIQQQNTAWLHFFKHYHIKPLNLVYEEICESKQYLNLLAEQVKVSLPNQSVEVPLSKVRNEVNDEWAKRFLADFPEYQAYNV